MLLSYLRRNIKREVMYAKEFGLIFYIKQVLYRKLSNKERYYRVIKCKLKEICSNTLREYTGKRSSSETEKAERIIWFFWWQGIEEAPEMVKCCYNSVVKNAGNYNVVLITENNYKQFILLPDATLKRFCQGYISFTHMSDIIRMHLLRDYGGVWVDACSFFSETIPDSYMQHLLMSKRKANNKFVTEGKWLIGLLATQQRHMILFDYMCDAYEEYFKKHKIVLDYFMTDYLISIAYDNISEIHNIIDNIPENNITSRELCGKLNNVFDNEEWNEICKYTWFHSLSWKKQLVKEINGRDTYYKKIVCQYENDNYVKEENENES